MFPFPLNMEIAKPWLTLDTVKLCLEIAAYSSATLFLIFKTFSGYFMVNLSLDYLRARRKQIPSTAKDQLVVSVKVKKGPNGTLRLRYAAVRIASLSRNWSEERQFVGIDRVAYDRSKVWKGEPNALDWTQERFKYRILNLPPGDASQFACAMEVPSGDFCSIQVVLMGNRKFWFKLGQWRASTISMPV